jgi:hypothetical protein
MTQKSNPDSLLSDRQSAQVQLLLAALPAGDTLAEVCMLAEMAMHCCGMLDFNAPWWKTPCDDETQNNRRKQLRRLVKHLAGLSFYTRDEFIAYANIESKAEGDDA